MTTRPLHIVVLAAGKGSRMNSDLPKVLHQIAGQSLLAHVLKSAFSLGPDCIHVVVGHQKQQVIDAFSNHPEKQRLNWVEQTEQLGTGHAVSTAMPAIPTDANVLMLTADVPLIQAHTLRAMVSAMAHAPLALLTADVRNPFGLGRITRDTSGNITGIVEQKDATEAQRAIREINSGILCARSADLARWLQQIGNQNAQQEYYLTDIVALAHEEGAPVFGTQPESETEVMGINTRVQLAEVERLFQQATVEALMVSGVTMRDPARVDIRGDVTIGSDTELDINVVIEGPTHIGRNVKIGPNCMIKASRLADNVTIHANTVIEEAELYSGVNAGPFARLRPGTVLHDNVRIGNFVETKNAQLSSGSKVNHLSYVGDALVGSDTNIGAGVITCNYDGANKHQTVIGNNVFVGSDCQLVAPVTIGDDATIGAGSTITTDVESGKLAISRGRQRQISGWQRPTKDKK